MTDELRDPPDPEALFADTVDIADKPDYLEFRYFRTVNILSTTDLERWLDVLKAGWRPVVNTFKHCSTKSSGLQGTAILMARMKDNVRPARAHRDDVYGMMTYCYGDIYVVNKPEPESA